MKKIVIAAAAASIVLSAPGAAKARDDQPAPDTYRVFEQSGQAADEACHGQGRAWYAERLGGGAYPNGYFISQRQGDQHEINTAWVEFYCGDWPGAN